MSSHINPPNTEAAILARLIETDQAELSRSAADFLLSIRFDGRDLARMNDLSERARQGALNDEEQAELDSYIHVSNLVAVMQSRGRMALRSSSR